MDKLIIVMNRSLPSVFLVVLFPRFEAHKFLSNSFYNIKTQQQNTCILLIVFFISAYVCLYLVSLKSRFSLSAKSTVTFSEEEFSGTMKLYFFVQEMKNENSLSKSSLLLQFSWKFVYFRFVSCLPKGTSLFLHSTSYWGHWIWSYRILQCHVNLENNEFSLSFSQSETGFGNNPPFEVEWWWSTNSVLSADDWMMQNWRQKFNNACLKKSLPLNS